MEPYRIEVPDGELVRLRLRLADARWPDRETVEDWSQGVPLQVVRDLCDPGAAAMTGAPRRSG